MANLRELRDRIRSVNSTKKITKAQELIATSRITKAQGRVTAAKPYAQEIQKVMDQVSGVSSLEHPMLHERENGKRAAVLVVTSDRGMAGGYNHNVLKKATELEKLLSESGYEVARYVTGSKGVEYYRFRGEPVIGSWTGFSQDPTFVATHDVRHHLIDGFVASAKGNAKYRPGLNTEDENGVQGFDQVHVVTTEFVSMLTQTPVVWQLLPIEPVIKNEIFEHEDDHFLAPSGEVEPEYLFEPDAETLFNALLPQYVSRRLFSFFLEAAAAESASRRNAMKSATDNATDLVNDLSRVANAARQAQITQEITEIVGGAGAPSNDGESD